MAREIGMTTQRQEFLKESYLKEIVTHANWKHHYGQNFPSEKRKPSTKQYLKLPAITDTHIRPSDEAGRVLCIDQSDINKHATEGMTSTLIPGMRPVSPKTLSILYNGVSRENMGRYRYLRLRNRIKPEEKYTYPLTTNWFYGWKLGGFGATQYPQYGRYCIVNDTFYRKNGSLRYE